MQRCIEQVDVSTLLMFAIGAKAWLDVGGDDFKFAVGSIPMHRYGCVELVRFLKVLADRQRHQQRTSVAAAQSERLDPGRELGELGYEDDQVPQNIARQRGQPRQP